MQNLAAYGFNSVEIWRFEVRNFKRLNLNRINTKYQIFLHSYMY